MTKFITFEGIDGSGKSTQIEFLEQKLKELNKSVKIFREPGSTALSEKIRNILLDKKQIGLSSNSESLLFAAARAQLTIEKIQPALNDNCIVICDRYIDSTVAYQGYGRGLVIEDIKKINLMATLGLVPDLTFVLDIDPKITKDRMDNEINDRIESVGIDFFKRIRNGYKEIVKENPSRCIEINANQAPEEVFNDIFKVVLKKL